MHNDFLLVISSTINQGMGKPQSPAIEIEWRVFGRRLKKGREER